MKFQLFCCFDLRPCQQVFSNGMTMSCLRVLNQCIAEDTASCARFHMSLNSLTLYQLNHCANTEVIKTFRAFKLSDVVFIMLIKAKLQHFWRLYMHDKLHVQFISA